MLKRCGSLMLLLLALGAAPRVYSLHYQVQRFHDCNAAQFYAADHPLVGLYQYRFQAQFRHTAIVPAGTLGYRGSAHVVYSLAPGQSIMFLPQWSWPNMTASQRQGLASFVSALRNHELGHVEIAVHGIKGRASTITVLGSTPAQARARLAAEVAAQLKSLAAEVFQSEQMYDRVTGHGTHQADGPSYGFRGGDDVVFGCR